MSSLGLPGGSIRRKLSDRKSKRESFNTRSALLTMSQGAGAVAVPIRIPQETREQIDKSKPFLAALFGQAEGRSPRDIAVNPNFKNVTVAAFPERQPVYNIDNSDPTVVDIAIHSKVGNKQRRAKADTGACANFMSYTTAKSLGLDIRDLEYNEKVDYITANDGTFQAEGSVSVEWHRLGSPRTRSTKFFVIQSEYFDVILGKDFLLETKFFMINPEFLIIHKDQKKGKSQNDADRAEKEKKQKEANLAARQKEKEKAKAKEAKEKAAG